MSAWTHAICEECWDERHPDRIPVQVLEGRLEQCCFCTMQTSAGIYIRHDPRELRCLGRHAS